MCGPIFYPLLWTKFKVIQLEVKLGYFLVAGGTTVKANLVIVLEINEGHCFKL
jgi:hypothetical protein